MKTKSYTLEDIRIMDVNDNVLMYCNDTNFNYIEPLAGVFARHLNCFEDINNPTENEWDYFFMVAPVGNTPKENIKKRFFGYVKWSILRGLHE